MAASGVAKCGETPAATGTTAAAVGDGTVVADGAGSDGLVATDGVAGMSVGVAIADGVGTDGLVTAVDATAAGWVSAAVLAAGAFELAQPASAKVPRMP